MNKEVLNTSSEVSLVLKFIDTTLVSVIGDVHLNVSPDKRVFKEGQSISLEILIVLAPVRRG